MVLAAASALLAAVAPHARADFSLELKSGSQMTIIADNSASDLNSTPGVIVFSGSVGTFSINITTGISDPPPGTLTQPVLDLNSIDVSGGSGTLEILLSQTGLGPSTGTLLAQVGGTVNNNGGTLTYNTFDDPGNGLFAETNELTSQGPFTPGAFSGSAFSSPLTLPASYSLTQDVTIVHTGGGSTSFDGEASVGPTQAVPEPGSIVLLVTGFLGFAATRLRKGRN